MPDNRPQQPSRQPAGRPPDPTKDVTITVTTPDRPEVTMRPVPPQDPSVTGVKAPIAPGMTQVPTTVVPGIQSTPDGATVQLGNLTFNLTNDQIDHLARKLSTHRDSISKAKSRLGPAWANLGHYENPSSIGGEFPEGQDPFAEPPKHNK